MSNGGFGGVHQKLLDALAASSYGGAGTMILYLHGFRPHPILQSAFTVGSFQTSRT